MAKRRTVGSSARKVAIDALVEIDDSDAYANLALGPILSASSLSAPDRGLVTDLVYGSIRMQRALDYIVDGFLMRPVEDKVRAALRIGAYQIRYTDTPDHAAVDATVGAVVGPARGLVNAVLRKVLARPTTWPDLATELSYPDWIVAAMVADHGREAAEAMLRQMNEPPKVSRRDDGYVQDLASQAVVAALPDGEGTVVDMCAAPGGKATGWAARRNGAVIGLELHAKRARLVADNAATTGTKVPVVVANSIRPPLRAASATAVLIDAPCSGLGSLRRRPDARWRIDADAPKRLAKIQTQLVDAGVKLLASDGVLAYSVCTLTAAEGPDVVAAAAERHGLEVEVPGGWDRFGGVGFLPPEPNADGMFLALLRKR